MTWEFWTGVVQVALGGALALAGQWLTELRARRASRSDRLDAALSALRSASWDFYAAANGMLRIGSLHQAQLDVLKTADEAIAALMVPRGGQRRSRRSLARLLRSIGEDYEQHVTAWDTSDDHRERALLAAHAMSGLVSRWRTDPDSLRTMAKDGLYELMNSGRSDR